MFDEEEGPPIERTDRDALCDSLNDPAEEEAVERQFIRKGRRSSNHDWLHGTSEACRLEWEAEKLADAVAMRVFLFPDETEGYDPELDDPNRFNPDDPFDRPEEEGRMLARRYAGEL